MLRLQTIDRPSTQANQADSRPSCSDSASSASSFSFAGNTIPREITSGIRTATTDPDVAGDMALERGQYRVVMRVPYTGIRKVHETDAQIEIPYEGETKRVWLYKIDLEPIDESDPNGMSPEGEPLAQVTLVFHVLDNVLPWVLIGRAVVQGLPRALPWIAGSIGSWFVVDKVEAFTTESFVGSAIGIAAAAAGLIFLLRD